MRYFGGKARIAKRIADYLKSVRRPEQTYVEPFVGSANVFCLMENDRMGSDGHPDLVMLLKDIQSGEFVYPENVTEEQYKELKFSSPSSLRAFVGFGCSYAGKWFGGYARDGNRNFCKNASSVLIKKSTMLKGAIFEHCDYRELNLPDGCLIYCDPPYVNHTPIHGKKFNTDEFWDVVRGWSKNHRVLVSEYLAPSDFVSVLDIRTKTDIIGTSGQYERVERLFSNEKN